MKSRERGAVTVEFALILPLLLVLILAIFEFGGRYQRSAELNNAAFIAARNMAIHDDQGAAETAASNALSQVFAPSAVPGTITVNVPADCVAGATVTVTITGNLQSRTQAFGSTFDVNARGVARCEG